MSEATPALRFEAKAPARGERLRLLSRMAAARRDDLSLALAAMLGHKLRAALTPPGIVIGGVTVVTMMSLTTGLQNSMDSGLGQLGADVFQIQKWPAVQFGNFSPEIQK